MLSRLFRVLIAACICVAAQDETPSFRTSTNLVDLTFIALDRGGKPVTDLKREEITIIDKGQGRSPVFFRFEGAVTAASEKRLPTGVFSNHEGAAAGTPRNLTAIVLDTLNTPPQNQAWARAQVMQYLRGIDPSTRIALYGLGAKLRIYHDFTDDASALRDRLNQLTSTVQDRRITDINEAARDAERLLDSVSEGHRAHMENMLKTQMETEMLLNEGAYERQLKLTLASLEALGNHLAGIPGRKSLVWIGNGVSMLSITGALGFGPRGGVKSYETLVGATSQRLATQGVVLYIVDAQGLLGPRFLSGDVGSIQPDGRPGTFERQTQAADISADTRQAMLKMAAVTGGRVFRNTNDLTAGVKSVANDTRATYSAGFYAAGEGDNKWHNLDVKVSRPGVRLLHRQGYLSSSSTSASSTNGAQWEADKFRAAAMNPLGSNDIRFDAQCERGVEGGHPVLIVTLSVLVSDLHLRKDGTREVGELDIGVVQKDGNGLPLGVQQTSLDLKLNEAAVKQLDTLKARHYRAWQLDSRTTSVRIIVRDLRGGHGTLDVSLRAVPTAKGSGQH